MNHFIIDPVSVAGEMIKTVSVGLYFTVTSDILDTSF